VKFSISNLKSQKGFTLIELLVAVGIMGLLVGGGVAAYVQFDLTQQLTQAGESMEVFLRLAQKRAAAGEKPSSGCGTLNGYEVRVTNGGVDALMNPICDGETLPSADTMTLGGDLLFGNDASFLFKVLSGGVSNPGDIDINSWAGTHRVSVTGGGAIVNEGMQ